jgi:hypothetical protein
MWRVRACEASTQQYLEEAAGYGQADCRIIPGTRELHGPASHWPLPDAALRSAQENADSPKTRQPMMQKSRCLKEKGMHTRVAT